MKECKNCKYHDTEPKYDRSHFEVCTRPESWMFDGFSSCDSMRTWPSMCGEGAKFYSPKKFKSRAYRASKMVDFVGRLLSYLEDRDWQRVEDAFPDEYEMKVCNLLSKWCDANLYTPKKRKHGTYTTDEMVAFVNRLIAYLDDRDWRRVEDIFPDEYEREVAKKLAGDDGELMHCAMCRHWKWNADMSGQCSLQLKGRCGKFENAGYRGQQ